MDSQYFPTHCFIQRDDLHITQKHYKNICINMQVKKDNLRLHNLIEKNDGAEKPFWQFPHPHISVHSLQRLMTGCSWCGIRHLGQFRTLSIQYTGRSHTIIPPSGSKGLDFIQPPARPTATFIRPTACAYTSSPASALSCSSAVILVTVMPISAMTNVTIGIARLKTAHGP